jgi:TolB-like protein
LTDSLFTELKRRNVFRVGVAYLAGSWLFVEVAGTLLETFGYGIEANRIVIIILAIGLIPVLIFSWVYELTSDGIIKESEIDRSKVNTVSISHKLDFLIRGLLVISTGYFIWESRFEEVDNISDLEVTGTSIAVLPFVNMSEDANNEYFSDGISEEILNVLAKLPKLKVTSRSSAFSFKGKEIILSEVANKLGVENILEGSVRKAGNKIRVTAQLIEAKTDTHLWSETYDRELTIDSIFNIQDEIAKSIVEALKSKLGFDSEAISRVMPIVDLDAHNEYLKGRYFIERRTPEDIEKALLHFNQAAEISPDYAPAWMGKAWAIIFLSEFHYGDLPLHDAIERARPAAEKALSSWDYGFN